MAIMKYGKEEIIKMLKERGIAYEVMEHPAVFTMEEMDAQHIPDHGPVCKNLFLRNAKGNVNYIVSLPEEKHPDMKALALAIASTRLSFGSADRLIKYLGVEQGSVSPLGVLNDESDTVEAILDEDLMKWEKIGVHPNDNTMTIWLSPKDLIEVMKRSGNPVRTCRIPG